MVCFLKLHNMMRHRLFKVFYFSVVRKQTNKQTNIKSQNYGSQLKEEEKKKKQEKKKQVINKQFQDFRQGTWLTDKQMKLNAKYLQIVSLIDNRSIRIKSSNHIHTAIQQLISEAYVLSVSFPQSLSNYIYASQSLPMMLISSIQFFSLHWTHCDECRCLCSLVYYGGSVCKDLCSRNLNILFNSFSKQLYTMIKSRVLLPDKTSKFSDNFCQKCFTDFWQNQFIQCMFRLGVDAKGLPFLED